MRNKTYILFLTVGFSGQGGLSGQGATACMTCSDCTHYDMINCFCWVRWLEISQADSYVSSCSRDDSREDDLEFF